MPSDDDSEAILANRLVRNLFQALSPESAVPRENRIEAFCQLAGASQTPYLRLRHIFTPDTWTAAAQSLCLLYLRFWRDAAAGFAAWPAERKRPASFYSSSSCTTFPMPLPASRSAKVSAPSFVTSVLRSSTAVCCRNCRRSPGPI